MIIKNRVYIECSETTRRVKATVISYDEKEIFVEMPSGFQMKLARKNKRRVYSWRIGMLEFSSDGKLVN
jgi:hypothetical protein